ncbi:MAG: hypothetical protein Q7K57_24430 [Burkholderiaceae bacterium]|nr:hypothetical protein [Burkholderiaceae bacterium]
MSHLLSSRFQRFHPAGRWLRYGALGVAGIWLIGCSPTLNWREVRLESTDGGGTLVAYLPCKPDRATRQQDLGGERVELSMMGCEAGGATFTLGRINLAKPVLAPQVLAAWQAATLANLRAPQPVLQLQGALPAQPISIQGASVWPPATRMTVQGRDRNLQVVWFARQSTTGVVLYQAALYGPLAGSDPNSTHAFNSAMVTFFESLHLP